MYDFGVNHVAMFVAGRHFYDRLSPSITASFNEPRRTESKSLLNNQVTNEGLVRRI